MAFFFRAALIAAAAHAMAARGSAQWPLPPAAVAPDSRTDFAALPANWRMGGALGGDPRLDVALVAVDGHGLVLNTATRGTGDRDLRTAWEHGDLELDFEFCLPAHSRSGILLQGRYEVLLADSWSAPRDHPPSGTIAATANDASRPPTADAGRAPGLWQRMHVAFRAPRFDAQGRKIAHARVQRLSLNGFTVQAAVELGGPTVGAAWTDERALGPLVLRGDGGPIAFRALAVKRGGPERVVVDELRYSFFQGDYKTPADYEGRPPTREGPLRALSIHALETGGRFGLVLRGTLRVPRDGTYAFKAVAGGAARLLVDDGEVIAPLEGVSRPGAVALGAGVHAFRLDLVHQSKYPPTLELWADGPGLLPHALTETPPPDAPGTDVPNAPNWRPHPIGVHVAERVRLQRAFFLFGPRKRVYAAGIGSPAGVHYAYDFQAGTVLRAWRGDFLDTTDMWEWRGVNQLARPAGPEILFHGKPAVAMFEFGEDAGWPEQPEALWTPLGYSLEADGQPVFRARLGELRVTDRIAARADGHGLSRTLRFSGPVPEWPVWLLLAEAATIAPQPDGRGWIVGDREYYIDWPRDAPAKPVLRSSGALEQLAVPLGKAALERAFTYQIVW